MVNFFPKRNYELERSIPQNAVEGMRGMRHGSGGCSVHLIAALNCEL
jgi:hypothetical protein